MTSIHRFSALALASVGAMSAARSQQPVPIRAVSAPGATSIQLKSIEQVREIAGGKLLVNSSGERSVFVFDASLAHPVAIADTMGGSASPYPRFAKLLAYRADTSFLIEADSRSLITITPAGVFGRVTAPPRTEDFNSLTSGGPVGVDARGNLVYQGRRPVNFPRSTCGTEADQPRPGAAPPPVVTDSVVIIRANFDTRTTDTVGKAQINVQGFSFPIVTYDASCKITAAKVRVNPSVPTADAWTVTSTGAIAIVRGHDYHIDWIMPDGAARSSPKMPYDWKRLTDRDKQARIDSSRRVVDSLTALGGYRLEACNNGRSISFNASPPSRDAGGPGRGGNSGGGGGGGGGSAVSVAGRAGAGGGGDDGGSPNPACQNATVAAEFVPIDSMADYIAPIRENAAMADVDGNVWILPTTSAGAKGGLLYDVVNAKGELFERVQVPAERVIAGFGRGGVVYLSHRMGSTGAILERVQVVR